MFNDEWRFNNDQLRSVRPPAEVVQCHNGFVRFATVPSVACDVDTVMSVLGFDRMPGPTPSYKDRHQRKMVDTVTLPFRFPPTAIHWDEIRKTVDRWFGGLDYDPANVFRIP